MGGGLHPAPLGACGGSTRLAPSALGLPQTLSLAPKLAVSRIDDVPCVRFYNE